MSGRRRNPFRARMTALVPGSFVAAEDGRVVRSARDWVVDVTFFLLSLGLGYAIFAGASSDQAPHVSSGLLHLDLAAGLVALLALFWRRTHPVIVGVLGAAAVIVSASATVAVALIVFSAGIHLRPKLAIPIAVATIGTGLVFPLIRPQPESFLTAVLISITITAPMLAWGMFVRARRLLVLSLRDRAERAEEQQRARAEQARLAERTRIAREMHDVLAHRISLIALHAGALEVNPTMTPDQVRDTGALLRSTAHQALQELRDVIGVLRAEDGTPGAVPPPQPTLADLPALVEDVREAGTNVSFEQDVVDPDQVPAGIGRDAYRVVQEALTNVGKHARGTATIVQVSGGPGVGLHVRVSNRLPIRAAVPAGGAAAVDALLPPTLPGAGAGLLGLRERVTLSGGTLEHGPDASGNFVVDARLRWERP